MSRWRRSVAGRLLAPHHRDGRDAVIEQLKVEAQADRLRALGPASDEEAAAAVARFLAKGGTIKRLEEAPREPILDWALPKPRR